MALLLSQGTFRPGTPVEIAAQDTGINPGETVTSIVMILNFIIVVLTDEKVVV